MADTQPQQQDRNPIQWNQDDAVALRQYIAANPKFLEALRRKRPKIEGDTMEARAVTGSDVKGFLECIESIEDMQLDPQAGQEEAGFIG